jgi:hypothetical protein
VCHANAVWTKQCTSLSSFLLKKPWARSPSGFSLYRRIPAIEAFQIYHDINQLYKTMLEEKFEVELLNLPLHAMMEIIHRRDAVRGNGRKQTRKRYGALGSCRAVRAIAGRNGASPPLCQRLPG